MRASNDVGHAGGMSAGIGPTGVATSVQRSRAASCGCAHTSAMLLTCALAICACSRRCDHLLAVSLENTSSMIAASASRAGDAPRVAVEARVARQLGLLQHLGAEHLPLALVLQAEHHRSCRRRRRTARTG